MIGMKSSSVSIRLTVRETGLACVENRSCVCRGRGGGVGSVGEKAELISYNPSSSPGWDW